MRVAVATFSAMPPEFTQDDRRIVEALRALGPEVDQASWDDEAVQWERYDAVVIRSTWDYSQRLDEFLTWVDRVGTRLHNAPPLVRWNAHKTYLADLAEAGIPTVPTRFVLPRDAGPKLDGEVVIKPTVSAGARDTGRFGPAAHGAAAALVESIQASGRIAMVQPYVPEVESIGETALVCLNGEPCHALRKGAILRPDEVAPIRDDGVGAAEVMYDPALVVTGTAGEAEVALARQVLDHVTERFGYLPLYARVDMIPGPGGKPMLMELEAIEPNLYLSQAEESVERVAAAINVRL